jgi:hypothetical protein
MIMSGVGRPREWLRIGVGLSDDITLSVLATVMGHRADQGWIFVDAVPEANAAAPKGFKFRQGRSPDGGDRRYQPVAARRPRAARRFKRF